MKSKFLLTCFFILSTILITHAQWELKYDQLIPDNHRVWSLKVTNDNSIWLLSTYDNFPPPASSEVIAYRSIDKGISWNTYNFSELGGAYGWDIAPIDSTSAFAALGRNGGLFKTINNGNTWEKIESYPYNPHTVHFFDRFNGWVIAETDILVMSVTTDGGETWTHMGGLDWEQPEGTSLPPFNDDDFAPAPNYAANSAYDVQNSTIIMGTFSGKYYKSIDKGHNWTIHETPWTGVFTTENVAIKDSLTFMFSTDLTTNFNLTSARTIATNDGGATWIMGTPKTTPATNKFIPGTTNAFIISGHNEFVEGDLPGTVVSYDLGQSWQRIDTQRLITTDFNEDGFGFGVCCYNNWEGATGGVYHWLGDSISSVVFVDQNATGTNTGKSWSDAYTNLTTALQNAKEHDQIWVATGIYTPTEMNGDRTQHFILSKNLQLYGGFAGTESFLAERTTSDHPTILSGDLNQDDLDEFSDNHLENAQNILFIDKPITNRTIVDGFTFSGGYANGDNELTNKGSGIQCLGSPIIRNCTFKNNYALQSGGGIYLHGEVAHKTRIEKCVFEKNRAEGSIAGGGIFMDQIPNSEVIITNCTFTENDGENGSGICVLNTSANIVQSDFSLGDNESGGGGIWFEVTSIDSQFIHVNHCLFHNNHSNFGGGIGVQLLTDNNIISVKNCLFMENHTTPSDTGYLLQGSGGLGINFSGLNSQIIVDSCQFLKNSSFRHDSALGIQTTGGSGFINIANCEFTDNSARRVSTLGFVTDGSTGQFNMSNCTFTGNTADFAAGIDIEHFNVDDDFTATISNCSFINNQAEIAGGLNYLTLNNNSLLLTDSYFANNSGNEEAGAILLDIGAGTNFTARRLQLLQNESPMGAAIFSTSQFSSSTFPDLANIQIDNCLIAQNNGQDASIVLNETGIATLTNNTIANNQVNGIVSQNSALVFQNNILYNPDFIELINSNSSLTSSGGNIINDDSLDDVINELDLTHVEPEFAATGESLAFYQLAENSPAIDFGQPVVDSMEIDLAGNPRIHNNIRIDAGALESSFMTVGVTNFSINTHRLQVSPNPARDVVKITLPKAETTDLIYTLTDAEGKQVIQQLLSPQQTLSLKSLSAGVYFLQTQFNNKTFLTKIVKQ